MGGPERSRRAARHAGLRKRGGQERFAAEAWTDPERPIRVRRQEFRTAIPSSLRRYKSSSALLDTSLGEIGVELWPKLAPYTVDNFIELSQGRRAWRDPVTGHSRTDRFTTAWPSTAKYLGS